MSETAVDALLLRFYGSKTPEEIAEITGIEAIDVAKRTAEILGRRDYLAEDAKVRLLIGKLESMVAEIESRMSDMKDRDLAPAINSARSAIGTVLKELRDVRKENKVDVDAISVSMGRTIGEVVDVMMRHVRAELKERYPTNDSEIDALVHEGLEIARKELDGRVDA